MQQRVLQRFHFGLRAKGLLFLGRSESIAQTESLFTPLDRRERLFRKQGESSEVVAVRAKQGAVEAPLQRRRDRDMQQLLDALVAHMEATVALCDSQGRVVHTAGEVAKFLHFPGCWPYNQSTVLLLPSIPSLHLHMHPDKI